MANPFGTNTFTSNPDFVLPSTNPAIADFHLQALSSAIDAGTTFFAPTNDKDGNNRMNSVDIGCYEYQAPVSIKDYSFANINLFAYPNPSTNTVVIALNSIYGDTFKVWITDLNGRVITKFNQHATNGNISFDISELPTGVYLARIFDHVNNCATTKFIKSN